MRHAEPHNPQQVVYGDLPGFPLSERGQAQAREVGQFLSNTQIDLIISSPLERTHQTADIITGLHPNRPPVVTNRDIRDINFGIYQGQLKIAEKDRDRGRYWQEQLDEANGFTSPLKVRDRMVAAFESAIKQHPDKSILFVSHAGVMAFLFESMQGRDLSPDSIRQVPYGIGLASVWRVQLEPSMIIEKIFTPSS